MNKPLSRRLGRLIGPLALLVFLCSCGKSEEQKFLINGEEKSCTVINQKPCGLTIACEDSGIYQCYTN